MKINVCKGDWVIFKGRYYYVAIESLILDDTEDPEGNPKLLRKRAVEYREWRRKTPWWQRLMGVGKP